MKFCSLGKFAKIDSETSQLLMAFCKKRDRSNIERPQKEREKKQQLAGINDISRDIIAEFILLKIYPIS